MDLNVTADEREDGSRSFINDNLMATLQPISQQQVDDAVACQAAHHNITTTATTTGVLLMDG